MTILSLDISSTDTGWAVLDNKNNLTTGRISTSSIPGPLIFRPGKNKEDVSNHVNFKRLNIIKSGVKKILGTYFPDIIIIESIPHSRMYTTVVALGVTHGVILNEITSLTTTPMVRMIDNLSWKRIIFPNTKNVRNLTKEEIRDEIINNYHFHLFSFDEVDAVAMLVAFLKTKGDIK